MQSERVAVIHRFNDAFNRRDFEAILRDLDPHVELDEWRDAPGAETYRGPDGVRRAFDKWFETWEWMQVDIEDVEEAGDRVLVTVYQRARGSASGAEVSVRSWSLYEFRDEKVHRLRLFIDQENAMEEWHGSGLEGAKTIGEEKA